MKSHSKSMSLFSRVETCGFTVVLFLSVTLPVFFDTTLPLPVLVPLSVFIPTKRLKNYSVYSMGKNQVVQLKLINSQHGMSGPLKYSIWAQSQISCVVCIYVLLDLHIFEMSLQHCSTKLGILFIVSNRPLRC